MPIRGRDGKGPATSFASAPLPSVSRHWSCFPPLAQAERRDGSQAAPAVASNGAVHEGRSLTPDVGNTASAALGPYALAACPGCLLLLWLLLLLHLLFPGSDSAEHFGVIIFWKPPRRETSVMAETSLVAAFRSRQFVVPEKLVNHFLELASSLRLSPENLATKFEVYAINSGLESGKTLEFEDFSKFHKHQAAKSAASSAKKRPVHDKNTVDEFASPPKRASTALSSALPGAGASSSLRGSLATPTPGSARKGIVASPASANMSSSVASTPSAHMLNSSLLNSSGSFSAATVSATPLKDAVAVVTENPGNLPKITRAAPSTTLRVSSSTRASDSADASSFRYMWLRYDDMTDALDEHLREISQRICQRANIDPASLVPAKRVVHEKSCLVGRIVVDTASDYPVDLVDAAGRRVHLNLAQVVQNGSFDGLFSGLVVVVEGTCPDGNVFIVENVLMDSTSPPAAISATAGSLPAADTGGSPSAAVDLCICCAAGPFGGGAMFEALLERARQADVLIVCGKLTAREQQILASPQSSFGYHGTVIVVPSHESERNPLFVYPQPENPTVLRISSSLANSFGLSIGVQSADILKALAKEEFSLKQSRDRSTSLCRFLLSQGCFYPLFPAPEGFPLDLYHMERLRFVERPHVLLFSSVVNPFVRMVDGAVCLNMRTMELRTFAWISVRQNHAAAASGAGADIRVDIERL